MLARRTLRFGIVGVLLLAACEGLAVLSPTTDPGASPTATTATASATTAPTAVANLDCISTPESAAAIADGLTVGGGGTLRQAFAVPLSFESDLNLGFVVAAEIDGPGIEGDGEVGTWAVGELGGGPIFAANQLAQEFSEWGAAASEGSAADLARDAVANSDEAAAAEACARGG
jgi:hypothetical protein